MYWHFGHGNYVLRAPASHYNPPCSNPALPTLQWYSYSLLSAFPIHISLPLGITACLKVVPRYTLFLAYKSVLLGNTHSHIPLRCHYHHIQHGPDTLTHNYPSTYLHRPRFHILRDGYGSLCTRPGTLHSHPGPAWDSRFHRPNSLFRHYNFLLPGLHRSTFSAHCRYTPWKNNPLFRLLLLIKRSCNHPLGYYWLLSP